MCLEPLIHVTGTIKRHTKLKKLRKRRSRDVQEVIEKVASSSSDEDELPRITTAEDILVSLGTPYPVRWSRKKKAGIEVWFGISAEEMPNKKVAPLVPDIFASYSGPDKGLALIQNLQNANTQEPADGAVNGTPTQNTGTPTRNADIAGARSWNVKSRKAYGICMSLYDQHPINGKISGDPIADSFAICARKNNALMIVADGVNWGEKSKLAARCAVYGCMKYMNEQLFTVGKPIKSTQDAFRLLLKSLDIAHEEILRQEGGLTTLCATLVCPVKDSKQYVVCIVNVGDSLAFVFSKHHGVREITTGSHDIQSERDIRDAGGALGPVNGQDPELHNLTCSMTLVDPGDIVYLTTDGISDNFDPVVTKIAIATRRRHSDPEQSGDDNQNTDTLGTSPDGKPEMEPHERHQYAVKEMERIIHEFELFAEQPCSAQELCGALLQHVLKLTDPKRKVLENPDLYGKKLRAKDRKRRDSEIVAKMSRAPGKLDHASIVGYEVGNYHGNDDENYEDTDEEEEEVPGTPRSNSASPAHHAPLASEEEIDSEDIDDMDDDDHDESECVTVIHAEGEPEEEEEDVCPEPEAPEASINNSNNNEGNFTKYEGEEIFV